MDKSIFAFSRPTPYSSVNNGGEKRQRPAVGTLLMNLGIIETPDQVLTDDWCKRNIAPSTLSLRWPE